MESGCPCPCVCAAWMAENLLFLPLALRKCVEMQGKKAMGQWRGKWREGTCGSKENWKSRGVDTKKETDSELGSAKKKRTANEKNSEGLGQNWCRWVFVNVRIFIKRNCRFTKKSRNQYRSDRFLVNWKAVQKMVLKMELRLSCAFWKI